MYCRKCGKEIPDDSNVCQYCGVRTVAGGDGSRPSQELQDDSHSKPAQDTVDASVKQAAGETADQAQEQNAGSETTVGTNAAKVAKPKSRTIPIIAAAAAVVVIVVVIGVLAMGAQGASSSGGPTGSARSESIVGEWKVAAISAKDDGLSSFKSGGATVKDDGSISVNLTEGSGLRMSGTWKAAPKANWPDVDDLVGYYDISLTSDGKKGSFTGAVTKTGAEYTLYLLMTNSPDTSLVFTRSA